MAKYKHYRCPDCSQVFEWLHTLADLSDLPETCPKCGSWVSEAEPTFVPKAPRIGKIDSPEMVYRSMEAASIERSKQAAAVLGIPESETAHMKMTDMKDSLREGDIAAVTRPTPTSTFMQQNSAAVEQARIAGAQFAANTRVGPFPGAGDRARQNVGAMHAEMVAQMVASGKRG